MRQGIHSGVAQRDPIRGKGGTEEQGEDAGNEGEGKCSSRTTDQTESAEFSRVEKESEQKKNVREEKWGRDVSRPFRHHPRSRKNALPQSTKTRVGEREQDEKRGNETSTQIRSNREEETAETHIGKLYQH